MHAEAPGPTLGAVATELRAARDRLMRKMLDSGLAPYGWTVGCRARFAPNGTRFELRPIRAPIVDGVASEVAWGLSADVVVSRRTRRFEVTFTPMGDDLAIQQMVDTVFAREHHGPDVAPYQPKGLPDPPF
jgi:hypothetical protein